MEETLKNLTQIAKELGTSRQWLHFLKKEYESSFPKPRINKGKRDYYLKEDILDFLIAFKRQRPYYTCKLCHRLFIRELFGRKEIIETVLNPVCDRHG